MRGIVIAIVVVGLWYGAGHITVDNRLLWVSCQPGWRWKIDQAKLREYRTETGGGWGVVYLSCRYKKASEGAGMVGYPEMLAYATQHRIAGQSLIALYPHKALWSIGDKERTYLATRLVVWEMAIATGETREAGERQGAEAAQRGGAVVELTPWRVW